MPVLISALCVYIAQRLRHASATLPGSAVRPQFSLTGSHTPISARHFLLFSLNESLCELKSVIMCLFYVSFIWCGQNGTLKGCHSSSLKFYFQLLATYFYFWNLKMQHFCQQDTTLLHLWISFEWFLPHLCPNSSGEETAMMAVEIHRFPPVAGMGSAPHPSSLLDRQCWWC